jgi:predicted permease
MITTSTSSTRPKHVRAALDTVARDGRYALRCLARTPVAALTIVTTLGLGLGLVAVVFTVLSAFVFRPDAVRNPGELFAVERLQVADAATRDFSREQYETLVRETDVFSASFASTGDVESRIDGMRREGRLVTGTFFQTLGVDAARGRPLVPSDDEAGATPVMVLSHRAWSQYFASDAGIVGDTVRVNDSTFEIIGVMPEDFRGLEVIAAPDFWAPLSLMRRFEPAPWDAGLQIVGRLSPGVSAGQALAELLAWDARRALETTGQRPAASLALEPRQGTVPLSIDVLLLFLPLFFAFGLILMIGCANVANLLLARGLARQREIGIRLSIGASRRRVLVQLLSESLLLSLISAALAFGISRLVLEGVVHWMTRSFPADMGNLRLAVPPGDWRVAMFLVVGAAISTVFFALAPALRATRVDPVRAMRGEVTDNVRPGHARQALVAFQVTGSVLLLICAAVFLRGAWASTATEPGIRTAGVLTVDVLNESSRATILEAVESEPLVAAVAASRPGVLGGLPAFADNASDRVAVTYQLVSSQHFGVLDIGLLRGRGFLETESSPDAGVAVLSESTARALWPNGDALGQLLRLDPDTANAPQAFDAQPLVARAFAVVGIANDVPGFRFGDFGLGGAGIYLPTRPEAANTALVLRGRGDAEVARRALIDRLAAIDPNMAQVATLQTFARAEAYLLSIPFWLTLVLGALALFLTASGIFGVLSYVVEQRTREIGVRTALGATRTRIGTLVLSQSARPVGIGLLLGTGFTAALGASLLATPAAALIASTVRLFDPIAYVGALACVVAACACASLIPALRAARVDPVGALRND